MRSSIVGIEHQQLAVIVAYFSYLYRVLVKRDWLLLLC